MGTRLTYGKDSLSHITTEQPPSRRAVMQPPAPPPEAEPDPDPQYPFFDLLTLSSGARPDETESAIFDTEHGLIEYVGPHWRFVDEGSAPGSEQLRLHFATDGFTAFYDPSMPEGRTMLDGRIDTMPDLLGNRPALVWGGGEGLRSELLPNAFGPFAAAVFDRNGVYHWPADLTTIIQQPFSYGTITRLPVAAGNDFAAIISTRETSEGTTTIRTQLQTENRRWMIRGADTVQNLSQPPINGDDAYLLLAEFNGAGPNDRLWMDGALLAEGAADIRDFRNYRIGGMSTGPIGTTTGRRYMGHIGPCFLHLGEMSDEKRGRLFDLLSNLGYNQPPLLQEGVITSFAESGSSDPSADLAITYVSTSADHTTLEYRPEGASEWTAVQSGRTRPVPEISNLWLHTALILGQQPDTLIDYRVAGTNYEDRVKTARRASRLEVVNVADWQTLDYTPNGALAKFGTAITSGPREPDLGVFNGDINNCDGRRTEFWSNDYINIVRTLNERYRTRGGALYPWVVIPGNHEVIKSSAENPAPPGQVGTLGLLEDFFTWSYHPLITDGIFHAGAGRIKIGNLYMLLTLDTNHAWPISGQVAWVASEMAAHAGDVAHVVVAGHVPPFNTFQSASHSSPPYRNAGGRVMRNDIWTTLQQYSGPGLPMRYWSSGHSHAAVWTRKLRFEINPALTPEQTDTSFVTSATGFQNIGFGQLASPAPISTEVMDMVSNIDGQTWWLGALHRDPDNQSDLDAFVTRGTLFSNVLPRFRNAIIDEFTEDSWTLEAINENGVAMATQVENYA